MFALNNSQSHVSSAFVQARLGSARARLSLLGSAYPIHVLTTTQSHHAALTLLRNLRNSAGYFIRTSHGATGNLRTVISSKEVT